MTPGRSDTQLVVIWLVASFVAVIMALNYLPAALVNGEYIPVGNDAFYHARRIIDAATGERGFYEFDTMIHVPEGSWLTWPWGYDYLMAQALKLALWLSPTTQPMAFLAYVPVFWVLVNTGLLALVARSAGLANPWIAVVLAGFVFSPLTQSLHGVGAIDHHFLELTFVLLAVWSGLRYLKQPASTPAAIQLGIAMGLAPAIHNSLFIIQLPLLLAVFLQWLRGRQHILDGALPLAAALFASTLAIVIPSQPFREGFFEFTTLSGFHLYVAFCSAAGILILGRLAFSARNFGIAAGLLLLLAAPLAIPFVTGVNYVAGEQIGLEHITEVAGPFEKMISSGTHLAATRTYGFLIFLTPFAAAYFVWLTWRRAEDDDSVFLGVAGALGLLMLVSQFRFHPFGYWALLIGTACMASLAGERLAVRRQVAVAATAVLLLLAMYIPITQQLFRPFMPSLSREYAVVQPMLYELAKACEADPGIALGTSDDGHPIRYHTDCSVIMNNFLLTPQHGQKLILGSALLQLSPEELPRYAPGVRYLLVHIYGIYTSSEDGPVPTPIDVLESTNSPLFFTLAVEGRVPPNYELLAESRVEDERDIAYAQVYRIAPPAAP